MITIRTTPTCSMCLASAQRTELVFTLSQAKPCKTTQRATLASKYGPLPKQALWSWGMGVDPGLSWTWMRALLSKHQAMQDLHDHGKSTERNRARQAMPSTSIVEFMRCLASPPNMLIRVSSAPASTLAHLPRCHTPAGHRLCGSVSHWCVGPKTTTWLFQTT